MAPGTDIQSVRPEEAAFADITTLSSKEPVVSITSVPATPEIPTPEAGLDHTLVLHPSLVTTDFELLRFHAAAFDQLPKANFNTTSTKEHTTTGIETSTANITAKTEYSTNLISSPYNNPGHYLSLPTLPLPSLLFAKALTSLQPLTPAYATVHYPTALNFSHVLGTLRSLLPANYIFPETTFYAVCFQSKLKPGVDHEWLYKLDYEAHREACESGGLLKYWFGKADMLGQRTNLATCFWHSREHAHKGGRGPWHAKARKAGREMYEFFSFRGWAFVVKEGAVEWTCEEWEE
ncbi:hypothetical protein BDU57DRAFT_553576 [Ampelomyces quisqualis]|uniref:Uncharacterized protein n=1 Tax=Ampelomyces quisqualis TaxID=50730 RepID=A0A6A5R056_AMPQU|nr:hypothetical protein BDU57DRAFT_553576 [Ampelomyces quisqualis]